MFCHGGVRLSLCLCRALCPPQLSSTKVRKAAEFGGRIVLRHCQVAEAGKQQSSATKGILLAGNVRRATATLSASSRRWGTPACCLAREMPGAQPGSRSFSYSASQTKRPKVVALLQFCSPSNASHKKVPLASASTQLDPRLSLFSLLIFKVDFSNLFRCKGVVFQVRRALEIPPPQKKNP